MSQTTRFDSLVQTLPKGGCRLHLHCTSKVQVSGGDPRQTPKPTYAGQSSRRVSMKLIGRTHKKLLLERKIKRKQPMKNRRVQCTTKLNFNLAKVRKKLLNSDDRTARAAGKYLSNASRLSNQMKQALLKLGRLLTKVVELQATRRAT